MERRRRPWAEARRGGRQPGAGENGEASGGCREALQNGSEMAALMCEAAGGAHARSSRRRRSAEIWEERRAAGGDRAASWWYCH